MRPSFSNKPSSFPTPRPSFSAKPTILSEVSRNAKPSSFPTPLTPRPSFSAKPTIRLEVSRSAKPTTYPEPTKFIVVVPSAIPSRPAYSRRPLPSDSELPSLIQATLTFEQADPAQITQPEKLQEIQINLGCILRTPLENIQINAIYWTFNNGTRITIAFDASIPALKSNGTVQCLTKNSQRLRRVQTAAAADGRVDVDYTVVAPSADLLAMDSSSYSALLTSSSIIQELASSVGSTGVSAPAPADWITTMAATDVTPIAAAGGGSSSSSSSGGLSLGASIVVGVGAAAVVIVIVAIIYTVVNGRKRKHAAAIQAVSRRVEFITQPAAQPVSLSNIGSTYFDRNQFNPMLSRN